MFSFSFFSVPRLSPPLVPLAAACFPLSVPRCPISSPSPFRPVFPSPSSPAVAVALSGPGTPYDAPGVPPFRPTVPPRNISAASRPGRSTASRLSQPAVPGCIERDHYNRPSITTLHITHYKLPVSLSFSLRPARSRPFPRPVGSFFPRCPHPPRHSRTKRPDSSNFRRAPTLVIVARANTTGCPDSPRVHDDRPRFDRESSRDFVHGVRD